MGEVSSLREIRERFGVLGGSHCLTIDLGVRFVMDLKEVSEGIYLKETQRASQKQVDLRERSLTCRLDK